MDQQPFFVTGSPKSGTTWLGKLLDAHPEISCSGEACVHKFTKSLIHISNEYNELLERRSENFSESNKFPPLKEAEVHAMMRYFIELRMGIIADPNKTKLKLVGEKDPVHAANFPILHKLFPEAKVLHIIRDGRDVALSAWHHNLRMKVKDVIDAGLGVFLDEAAKQWAWILRRALDTAPILGEQYLEVRYERLLSDPLPQMKRILSHLGADATDETAQACLDAASFEKLSQGRKQGEEDSKSFFRKGVAEDWKNQMTAAQAQRFNARSEGLLEELGYQI